MLEMCRLVYVLVIGKIFEIQINSKSPSCKNLPTKSNSLSIKHYTCDCCSAGGVWSGDDPRDRGAASGSGRDQILDSSLGQWLDR